MAKNIFNNWCYKSSMSTSNLNLHFSMFSMFAGKKIISYPYGIILQAQHFLNNRFYRPVPGLTFWARSSKFHQKSEKKISPGAEGVYKLILTYPKNENFIPVHFIYKMYIYLLFVKQICIIHCILSFLKV